MVESLVAALNSPILWTAVAALAASLSALFAAFYTLLTYRLLRSQREPNVVVYVKPDETRPTILQIVVENIGRGLASDIRFHASRPIPSRAWGVTVEDAVAAEELSDGPLIHGIPALGPGDLRKITWGQYGGLRKALGDQEIILTYEYTDGRRAMPGRAAVLEYRSLTDVDAVYSETAAMVKQLRRIADVMDEYARKGADA